MIERWVTFDPGEDCGGSIWEDDTLIMGFTLKMGVVDLMFYHIVMENMATSNKAKTTIIERFLDQYPECREVAYALTGEYRVAKVVCEDWTIYPWEARAGSLDWDECRTARLIGALRMAARLGKVPFYFQGAKIKETAVAGGAEQLFYTPLRENRHQNDAIMHGVHWLIIEEQRAPKDGRS